MLETPVNSSMPAGCFAPVISVRGRVEQLGFEPDFGYHA
jgi:hypothetical protein